MLANLLISFADLGKESKVKHESEVMNPAEHEPHSAEAEKAAYWYSQAMKYKEEVERLREVLEKMVKIFDSEIHSEYDGTSMLEDRLSEAAFARKILERK